MGFKTPVTQVETPPKPAKAKCKPLEQPRDNRLPALSSAVIAPPSFSAIVPENFAPLLQSLCISRTGKSVYPLRVAN